MSPVSSSLPANGGLRSPSIAPADRATNLRISDYNQGETRDDLCRIAAPEL